MLGELAEVALKERTVLRVLLGGLDETIALVEVWHFISFFLG
jgi:hypothetical protein